MPERYLDLSLGRVVEDVRTIIQQKERVCAPDLG